MSTPFYFVKYGTTRYWAVMAGSELLAVVLYRRGASALVTLLQRLQLQAEQP